jgi:hypothetical protein
MFSGGDAFVYRLLPSAAAYNAVLSGSTISVSVPLASLREWELGTDLGLYHDDGALAIAIEKDLECKDGPPEEYDPYAFPRKAAC